MNRGVWGAILLVAVASAPEADTGAAEAPSDEGGRMVDRLMARVGGRRILWSELRAEAALLLGPEISVDDALQRRPSFLSSVLGLAVRRALVVREAERLRLPSPGADVLGAALSVHRARHPSDAAFLAFLQKSGWGAPDAGAPARPLLARVPADFRRFLEDTARVSLFSEAQLGSGAAVNEAAVKACLSRHADRLRGLSTGAARRLVVRQLRLERQTQAVAEVTERGLEGADVWLAAGSRVPPIAAGAAEGEFICADPQTPRP